MSRKLIYVVTFVLVLGLVRSASASLVEDFDDPAVPIGSGGTYISEAFTLDSGEWFGNQIRGDSQALGGTGVGVRINDDIASPGAYITTPNLPNGAGTVTYWVRERASGSGGGEIDIQVSIVSQDSGFSTVASRPFSGETWVEEGVELNQPGLCWVRFANINNPGHVLFDQVTITDMPLGTAFNPSPAEEATDVPRDVVLSWTPGEFAPAINGHTVYFSESFNDVNDDIGGIAADANNYTHGRLDFGKTYYWRVDEVNGPPDFTVYKGDVWQFTVEPFSYPVENVITTASSQSSADEGPENTINGSGLDANDLHSAERRDMWLSSSGGAEPAWIQYEFEKVYKLHQMWVWNYNVEFESILGFGLKDVTLEYSTDCTDWKTPGGVPEFAQAPGQDGYAYNTTVDFDGVPAKCIGLTANSSWGGLSQCGLSEVRFLYIPVHAREPYPDSGAKDVDVDVTLGFRAGRDAAQHDVYLSTDEKAVIDGAAPVITVNQAQHGPLSLDLGKTYYWRVDEVYEIETPVTWQGTVWNFTTQEYFVVDDFESYNDLDPDDPETNRIFNVWTDGYEQPSNGSVVGYEMPPFCEQTIVNSGNQSMPLSYSNTGGAVYSEAERNFAAGQDWTRAGAATLVLYFHGTEGNTGQLYMKVDGSTVVYNGAVGDIAKPQWHRWSIDLAQLGVDLQSITKLSIGIDGNGASGTLYIDDIRLYRPTP